MLYTEKSLGQALKQGTFTLSPGDLLTPAARDLLHKHKGESLSACRGGRGTAYGSSVAGAPVGTHEDPSGQTHASPSPEEKPEHLTHLFPGELVPKTHPRIAFRGKLDSLQGQILLTMQEPGAPGKALEEMLEFCRSLMRCDVLGEPVPQVLLHGMTEGELRHRSHNPRKYYGTAHILPCKDDTTVLLQLNYLRTQIRETELKSYEAFPNRTDIHRALNRLSSLCWILCLEEREKNKKGGPVWTGLQKKS